MSKKGKKRFPHTHSPSSPFYGGYLTLFPPSMFNTHNMNQFTEILSQVSTAPGKSGKSWHFIVAFNF